MTKLGAQPSQRQFVYLVLSVICLGLLAGCQSLPKHHDTDCRQVGTLNGVNFELSGKLALSDGVEGGSGRLIWKQYDNKVHASFKAPLGQGNWTIEEQANNASLVVNSETPYYAQQAETLIEEAVGWSVPWQALKKWLLAQPVDADQAEIKNTATSKTINEQGWTLVYDRFQSYPQGCLPHRIMASKAPYSIRLVVRDWQWR